MAYRDANRNAAFALFSGIDTKPLTNLLKDGNSVRIRNVTQATVENVFYQNLMVYAIPQLWLTSKLYINFPVVILGV